LVSVCTSFSRDVVARFDGGQITTEAGALLLRPVEQRTGVLRQFACVFRGMPISVPN